MGKAIKKMYKNSKKLNKLHEMASLEKIPDLHKHKLFLN